MVVVDPTFKAPAGSAVTTPGNHLARLARSTAYANTASTGWSISQLRLMRITACPPRVGQRTPDESHARDRLRRTGDTRGSAWGQARRPDALRGAGPSTAPTAPELRVPRA